MKIAEIEVGKEYAVGSPQWPDKVVVKEIGIFEGFRSSFSRRGKKLKRVKVAHLNYDGSEGSESTLTPQQVLMTWEEHEKVLQHSRELLARRQSALQDRRAAAMVQQEELMTRLQSLGCEIRGTHHKKEGVPGVQMDIDRYGNGKVTMNYADMLVLLQRVQSNSTTK